MDYSANAEAGDFPDSHDADTGERAAVPASVKGEDTSLLDAVMPVVEELVDAANPTDKDRARQYRWALAPMAVWLHHRSGSFHQRLVDERNVDVWIHVENAGQTAGWRHLAIWALRRIGRTVNPEGWSRPSKKIGSSSITPPYEQQDETLFQQSAALPKHQDRSGCLFVAAASFGAGLDGPEIRAAETGDLLDVGNGRLAIATRGRRQRLVPIRADYTAMIHEAALLADGRDPNSASNRFLTAVYKEAPYRIAARLDFGKGPLGLPRARTTWIMAHLRAGTPIPALRKFAGGLAVHTIEELSALAADELDPMDAVMQGLKA